MISYLVDSDILSFFINGNPRVLKVFQKKSEANAAVAISVITYFEILRGFKRHAIPHREQQFRLLSDSLTVFSIDESIGEIAAGLYADLGRRGALLPDADLLIAATALRHGATLVTNNIRHFNRIPDLKIENWSK